MSRRRWSRPAVAGELRVSIECDGREDHRVERIARARLTPRPDLGPGEYAVQIEYVRIADDPEENDYMLATRLAGPNPHMTRRFVCSVCGRDVPITDVNLARIAVVLDTLGQRHLRLREVGLLSFPTNSA